jgi:hypothetical protein
VTAVKMAWGELPIGSKVIVLIIDIDDIGA